MLLYRIPSEFADADQIRNIAQKVRDYTVFRRPLNTNGTMDEYFQSLHYELAKRNGAATDDTLDDSFPSFEVAWRQSLSESLKKSLVPRPEVASSDIHRVLPVGVSKDEAIQCFQSALPPDLTGEYVLTVESEAKDDQCGSIAITQRTQHIVVHMKCNVDPAVSGAEVCRELRVGYRSVVSELSRTKLELGELATRLEQVDKKFSALHQEMQDRVKAVAGDRKRNADGEMQKSEFICKKATCSNVVKETFVSGAYKKQCRSCIGHGNPKKM